MLFWFFHAYHSCFQSALPVSASLMLIQLLLENKLMRWRWKQNEDKTTWVWLTFGSNASYLVYSPVPNHCQQCNKDYCCNYTVVLLLYLLLDSDQGLHVDLHYKLDSALFYTSKWSICHDIWSHGNILKSSKLPITYSTTA